MNPDGKPIIGVLSLQGGYAEHVAAFRDIGVSSREVRTPGDLEDLDGLVLPGGESTAIGLLAQSTHLIEPLRWWRKAGRPTWGTCAGLIMLADRVFKQKNGGQALVGGLDVTASRNHFGSQLHSFEAEVNAPLFHPPRASGIFIRAPAIVAYGPDVRPVATLADGTCVGVQQGAILATAFHPELTGDDRWHRHFLDMVVKSNAQLTHDG